VDTAFLRQLLLGSAVRCNTEVGVFLRFGVSVCFVFVFIACGGYLICLGWLASGLSAVYNIVLIVFILVHSILLSRFIGE
jgi:hypothetical protein